MNKISLFILALFFALTLFPFAFSTTNVNVISPNGNELWAGTHNITWDFNDTANNQNVYFDIYYSAVAGNKNFFVDRNLSFSSYCNNSLTNSWLYSDVNYNVGLPTGVYSGKPYFYNLNGSSYLDYVANDNNLRTLKWNGSTWIENTSSFSYDKNIGIKSNDSINVFNLDNKILKMFGKVNLADSVGNFKTYYLSGSNWIETADYNSGLKSSSDSSFNYVITQENNGVTYLMDYNSGGDRLHSYLWNGSFWSVYESLTDVVGNFDGGSLRSITTFSNNDSNYLITTSGSGKVLGFKLINGLYYVNNDINSGIQVDTNAQRRFLYANISGNDILMRSENPVRSIDYPYKYNENIYSTSTNSTCSYSWNTLLAQNGTWFLDINAVGSTNKLDSSNSSFQVYNYDPNSTTTINITPINNVGSYNYDGNKVNIYPSNDLDPVIFKAVNNTGVSKSNLGYNMVNFTRGAKNYLVYTSSDGLTYTFNTSITFGTNKYNGVQKVWNDALVGYNNIGYDNLSVGETKYYKFVYSDLPVYYETINSNTDWVNFNQPTNLSDASGLHNWDVYQDSNLTNVQSYTIKPYPQLTSTDLNAGFYVQFTGYASTTTSLSVGTRDINSGLDSTQSISLNTIPTRYSVFVQPSTYYQSILIKSTSNTPARIYLSDYAIVPTAYFIDRLELYTQYGSPLDSIVRSGASYNYVSEAIGFMEKTRAYNQNGNLSKLRTEVKVDGIIVKTYEIDLNGYIETGAIDLTQILDGVTDFNGSAFTGLITLTDLKNLSVVNTLIDRNGKSVAEQSNTVKLLQYPYSAGDISFKLDPLNKKLSENPEFSLNLTQRYPQALIGLTITIYDSSHSRTSPNYTETIYTKDLGCYTDIICQKTLTLTKWKFPEAREYTVLGALILNTEAQSYSNNLTLNTINITTTQFDFETARVLQVFERRNLKYNSTENIPLVFQVREDNLRNLKNEYSVFMQIDTNEVDASTGGQGLYWSSTKYTPSRFIYDDVTGYNYWLWNSLFYTDSGQLIGDGNKIFVRAVVVPLNASQTSATGYGLVNKCQKYRTDANGLDINVAGFNMNWEGLVNSYLDAQFGCLNKPDLVVGYQDIDVNYLIIDNSYTPKTDTRQSVLFCLRNPFTNVPQDLSSQLICGLLYKKSEVSIDKFNIYLGNQYSDYSKKGDEAQYINLSIPIEEVMFNDIGMMATALSQSAGTQGLHTWNDYIRVGLNEYANAKGYYSYLDNSADFLTNFSNLLVLNSGVNTDFNDFLNPNTFDGSFFFTFNGLKTINVLDYVDTYPQLNTLPASEFRTFALNKKIVLPNNKIYVAIVSSNFKNIRNDLVSSPLVIRETPTTNNPNDINSTPIVTTNLKFNVISDMIFNNQTQGSRISVPIVLSSRINKPFNLFSFLNDPIGSTSDLLFNNWFLFVLLISLALVTSLIYANIKGGGLTIINNREK